MASVIKLRNTQTIQEQNPEHTSREFADKTGLAEGTPLYCGSGDQQRGAVGVGNSGESGLGSVCLGTAGNAP